MPAENLHRFNNRDLAPATQGADLAPVTGVPDQQFAPETRQDEPASFAEQQAAAADGATVDTPPPMVSQPASSTPIPESAPGSSSSPLEPASPRPGAADAEPAPDAQPPQTILFSPQDMDGADPSGVTPAAQPPSVNPQAREPAP